MNLSPQGLDLLKKLEGFKSKPYKCSAGKLTIGYGHVILPHEKFTEVTIDEANTLLKKDVAIYEKLINRLFSGLKQNQYDALVLFCFNTGGGQEFLKSNVVKYIKLRLYDQAIVYWKQWIKVQCPKTKGLVPSQGLQNRREKEISLFLEKVNKRID